MLHLANGSMVCDECMEDMQTLKGVGWLVGRLVGWLVGWLVVVLVCVYVLKGVIYTWNPNDPCFYWTSPCFAGLEPNNRGQTGSRRGSG